MAALACNARTDDRAEREAREAAQKVEEAAREAGQAAERAAERAEPALEAAKTTAEIKTALLADPAVSAFNVDVDTSSERRTVSLRGTVDTEAARARAEEIAKEKAPQYTVQNELRVGSARSGR
jgi:osmotically-inducible protein OsmY